MKKYLIFVGICILSYFAYDYLVYYDGDNYIVHSGEVENFTKVEDGNLWLDTGEGFEIFDIKGMNLGLGKPGKFATEYSISKDEYLNWFKQIQDLGANVIRTYTIAHSDFYEAFYDYNLNNPTPLYLIHGVWVDDYILNSHRNAFDEKFHRDFLDACKDLVDVIHGRHKKFKLYHADGQTYKHDISPWVYGYIIGVEWEGDLVTFTNKSIPQVRQFKGDYLYTEDANNFEIFLAGIGNEMISYETSKYGVQRSLAFSNWPTTDPFEYPENIALQFEKFGIVDVENIKSRENFKGGQYASYHVYPYYPEYMYFVDDSIENTYLAYLEKLADHHDMPVVITEFGVSSSRGMASYEQNEKLARNQGKMSEQDQGYALISMYEDIKKSGCAGGIVFVWQDEWFKRTWNTVPFIDLTNTAYWSDYQTNEQYFGLLSFDPGKTESIVYVDGNKSEWEKEDLVVDSDTYRLSMKYDEKFLYFLAEKENFNPKEEKIYIAIDSTDRSGSRYIAGHKVNTSHDTDFLIEIDSFDNSRIWVHERYNTVDALYGNMLKHQYDQHKEPPRKYSIKFDPINLVLHELDYFNNGKEIPFSKFELVETNQFYSLLQSYESGKLEYGDANPKSEDFNSLADFKFGEGFLELKIPWQLLNFSDPVEMKIHDDYYDRYGVENIRIDGINVGLGDSSKEIQMKKFELKGLGKKPDYHERLKESYYILQDYWKSN